MRGLSRASLERIDRPGDVPAVRNIPYDYVTSFQLDGRAGRVHQDVINLSVEGLFVAQEVSYGFAAVAYEPMLELQMEAESAKGPLARLTLGSLPVTALVSGFRLDPSLSNVLFSNGTIQRGLPLNRTIELAGLQRARTSAPLHFLFQVIDSGTGREFQNLPMHNVASLGAADGERPFRLLASPIAFLPRSAIRVQVEEGHGGAKGELQIAFHGYKALGAADLTEVDLRISPALQQAKGFYGPRRATKRVLEDLRTGRITRDRVIPFDYVVTAELEGVAGRLHEREITVNVEGGFTATAVGYGLSPSLGAPRLVTDEHDPGELATIALDEIPAETLKTGLRLRPEMVCPILGSGRLVGQRQDFSRVFEHLNRPEDVLFKFRVIDTGTGRELQDALELNVAGLGSADGDRPFRQLAYPLRFLPRSSLRVQIQEIAGRGRLFIAFHGYKTLAPER